MKDIAFAQKGSQRWLQITVAHASALLEAAFQRAGVTAPGETVAWGSPLAADGFCEYRDEEALRHLGIENLSTRNLADFWPARGPVWDALGVSSSGTRILLEAKAHIPEAASPGSKAEGRSRELILQSLAEARKYYAPRARADWFGPLYQYANRLAFQYLLNRVNGISSRLVFLNFCHAADVGGPQSEAEWEGATQLIHALLGLPSDLRKFGVFHAYVDVRELKSACS